MKKLIPLLFIVFLVGCTSSLIKDNGGGTFTQVNGDEEIEQVGELTLTSPAFSNGESIPIKYSCDGNDINPELNIRNIPEEAESLVLILDDPDAPMGTWVHWVMFNIPIVTTISENSVPSGAIQGINSGEESIYHGPCPPPGPAHRYYFKLYALDTILELEAGATKQDVENAMNGHILEQTQLMGTYQMS